LEIRNEGVTLIAQIFTNLIFEFWFAIWESHCMKGRRRILLILAACAVVALLAAVFWPKEREPVYQGKKLSEWLARYCVSTDSQVPDRKAEEAILGIGTNALPVLVKWIAREPPDWKKGLVDELERSNKGRLWQRIWYPALSDMEAGELIWASAFALGSAIRQGTRRIVTICSKFLLIWRVIL